MTISFRPAADREAELVLGFMREFYGIEHLRFDEAIARAALDQLFAARAHGTVFLILVDDVPSGYLVLAINFSLEFHGRYAWIDELYVRESVRGRGVGTAALAFVEQFCRDESMAVARLEVARRNAGASRLYRRSGYEDSNRDLLTRWIR